jgi:hypothetical protein
MMFPRLLVTRGHNDGRHLVHHTGDLRSWEHCGKSEGFQQPEDSSIFRFCSCAVSHCDIGSDLEVPTWMNERVNHRSGLEGDLRHLQSPRVMTPLPNSART